MIWNRNIRNILKESPISAASGLKGSDTIVIHPGSRWLRVGRSTDPFPVSVPHVIARKVSADAPKPPDLTRILKPHGDGESPSKAEVGL